MRMPKYIVHRVDVDGLTVTLTDVTDSVIVSEIDNTPSVAQKQVTGKLEDKVTAGVKKKSV